MTKLMRKLPLILAAVFLLVQITGLAEYVGLRMGVKDNRSLLYAVALEVSIFAAFYWTRQSITRESGKVDRRDFNTRIAAAAAGILFMVASGTLNTFKVLADFTGKEQSMDWYGALLVGISPTLFAAMLGALQGLVDRLPTAPHKQADNALGLRVYAIIIKGLALMDARLSAAPAPVAGSLRPRCKDCGQAILMGNQGTHSRYHCKKRKVTK